MRILLCVLALLATALSDSPTELKVRNGVIYNEAALEDSPNELQFYNGVTYREAQAQFANLPPSLTLTVKLDTVGITYQWWLYLTQTTPEYVRRFRVCRIEMVEERR